jgi:hypothetical protein
VAITEDASSPVAVDSSAATWGTVATSASFTPPATSLIIVMLAFHGSVTGTATSCTVTDSGGRTWSLLKRQNTNGGAAGGTSEIWCADAGSSTATTVSVQQTAGTAGIGHGSFQVKVLNGAKSRTAQTGATGSAGGSAAANAASITTTTTGSRVYGAFLKYDGVTALTANGNSTIIHNFQDAGDGDDWGQIKAAADTGTPGAISIGVTAAAFESQWALVEILATATASSDVFWQLARVRNTGPRQITGPYSRQFQFGVDAVAAGPASGTASLDLTASATAQAPAVATGSLTLTASATASGQATATGSLSLTATAPASANPAATASLSLTGSATWTEPGSAALTLTATSTASASPTASGCAQPHRERFRLRITDRHRSLSALTATGTAKAAATGTGALVLTPPAPRKHQQRAPGQ